MSEDEIKRLTKEDKSLLFDKLVAALVQEPREKRDAMITQNTRITVGTALMIMVAIAGNIWAVVAWKKDIESETRETARDQIKGAHLVEWAAQTERLNQAVQWHAADVREVQAKINQTQ